MSDNNRLLLAIIIGSTRQGRFAPTVANWFAGQAGRRDDMALDVIDLAEARLPEVLRVKLPQSGAERAAALGSEAKRNGDRRAQDYFSRWQRVPFRSLSFH
jgi:NADPH-dependent FMN reductase